MKRIVTLLVAVVVLLLGVPLPAGAVEAGNDAFQRTWDRTDKPVEQLVEARTWMWGPRLDWRWEDYAESPNGARLVAYFEKSRMEINQPGGDQASPWYVTNGLLVAELISGRMQVGDFQSVQREPSTANVAGDPGDRRGPTYATFATLRSAPPLASGAVITQRVDRAGTVTDDPALARHDARAAFHVLLPGIDHHVASPFWEFMNSPGVIWENGGYVHGPLFANAFYATGLTLSEAYWTTVEVGGTPRDVLVQAFERRVLTWTPDNPEGWQVESGNVGRHYYEWRYGPLHALHQGRIAYGTTTEDVPNLHHVMADGTLRVDFSAKGAGGFGPRWSPDGSLIAFNSYGPPSNKVWLVNRYGTGAHQIPGQPADHPMTVVYEWSPDGQWLSVATAKNPATEGSRVAILAVDGSGMRVMTTEPSSGGSWSPDGSRIVVETGGNLVVVDIAIGVQTPIASNDAIGVWLCWSPTADRIAFRDTSGAIVAIDADGTDRKQLTPEGVIATGGPLWSPDGSQIAFVRYIEERTDNLGLADLWVMNADGSGLRQLTTGARIGINGGASWSPDSRFLAYTDGPWNASVIRIVNVGHPDWAYPAVAFGVAPEWSPADGPWSNGQRGVPSGVSRVSRGMELQRN